MLLYVASTNRVVSAVVVVERNEDDKSIQRPVYYLSEVLSASKQNYPHYQKMAYGVYMSAKKLKHYFEEHPIKVICEAPIAEILSNKDASGRIAKWAIELSPYAPQLIGEMQSSLRQWPTSLWIGPRYNMNHRYQIQIIGQCTL